MESFTLIILVIVKTEGCDMIQKKNATARTSYTEQKQKK